MTPAVTSLQARLSACRGVLVDSNVLLDVATNDPGWGDWSARALAEAAEHTTLIINPIIYVWSATARSKAGLNAALLTSPSPE